LFSRAQKRGRTLQRPYGDLARPERLPKPNCRVVLVCGPPAAGKSTYVREHKRPEDSLIDIDTIAKDWSLGRDRSSDFTPLLLTERNRRLAKLACAPREHVAWVIITAASEKLRAWWREKLAVVEGDMILLVPSKAELIERVRNDPERQVVRELHERLIDEWFQHERTNTVKRVVRGCDASGRPTDPLHPWNN
jgi:5-methylcytosine-specific restriction protein A